MFSKGWAQAWPLGIETLNAPTINNKAQKEHGLCDPLHFQPIHLYLLLLLFFHLKANSSETILWRRQGTGERKIHGAETPMSFPQTVFLSLLQQRLHFPDTLVGRCDHVTRLWPMDVSRSDVGSSQAGSIKTSEISPFLSLADGEMERVLPRAWRRDEPQDGNSLGPWRTAWKEVCKARNTLT